MSEDETVPVDAISTDEAVLLGNPDAPDPTPDENTEPTSDVKAWVHATPVPFEDYQP